MTPMKPSNPSNHTPEKALLNKDYKTHPVGTYIDRTMKLIRWSYQRAFLDAGYSITTEQWVLMDRLHDSSGLSQTDLANETFKNTATVSRIIDLLSKKDYIERLRFDNDRRRYKIFLTDEGRRIVQSLRPLVYNLRRKGWEGISPSEFNDFVQTINRIYQNFESNI